MLLVEFKWESLSNELYKNSKKFILNSNFKFKIKIIEILIFCLKNKNISEGIWVGIYNDFINHFMIVYIVQYILYVLYGLKIY